MPFEKGNTYGALGAGMPKAYGREIRKANRSLAIAIREGVSPDAIRDWLVSVWQGKDPLDGSIVPIDVRERALKLLLDRGWGQAAQMLTIDAQVHTETTTVEVMRPKLTLEQINERRAALRAILPAPADTPTGEDGGAP